MKKYYLITPGPTPVPPEVASQSALPVLHHRTHEFGSVFDRIADGLKYVFQTKNDVFLLTSSGTGAMESAVANTLSPGDKAIVATSGSFGDRWGKICAVYGVQVVWIKEEWGKPIPPEKVREALKANPDAKAVFMTHTETSTGTVNDLKAIGAIVAETKAISIVDAISGLGGEELRMDDWKLDVVVSGSQKGLMTAPGLAFAACSPKAWALVEASKNVRFYFDYISLKKSIKSKETPFTPAVSLCASLDASLNMLRKDGIENVWARHRKLAKAARAGMQALGLPLFSAAPCSVLTAGSLPASVDGAKMVDWMRDEHGVSVAGGQEQLKGKIVRLAHMGYMDQFDLIIGLTTLEWALKKFGAQVPAGKAVQAAQEALV
ncbi:MAG: alanine--glyoxylate aminotransferase family protein [Elusimicrobia bacterium]|nr:alanine--glyoxylate aminotransferase family protein [Elusimicrobiota bacterium]